MHAASFLRRFLGIFLVSIVAAGPVAAQTVGILIPAGSNPAAIAVNPNTNKIYVANDGSDNVTVINRATGAITTVAVGARPDWIAINPETNKIYVADFGRGASTPNVKVINGATDTVTSTLVVGDVGWTVINPITNKAYMIRYGNGDEVNIIHDETYVNTAATRSYKPVALSINPYTNVLYVVHEATGDVVAIDVSVDSLYPTLLCPNGSGGFKPSPTSTDPDPGPCINIPDPPVAVAVNPITNKIYAVSSTTSSQISVINGVGQANPHTFISLTPPGVTGAAKAIAVNAVSNKIYAIFANHIVVVDGASNAMTVIPSGSAGGGPVGIGINTTTNKIYVPNADGSLKVIDGDTNTAVATLSIPAGAVAIAVNPVTNSAYVISPSGVSTIDGSASDTVHTNPINTAITQTATGANPAFRFDTNSVFSPTTPPIRRVYYQLDSKSGPWTAASGSGPFTGGFTGLAAGNHTVYAFATDGQDAPLTGAQSNPLVGNIVSLQFTVAGGVVARRAVDFNADGFSDILFRRNDGTNYAWEMNGRGIVAQGLLPGVGTNWVVAGIGDFNGDGHADILWRDAAAGANYVWNLSGAFTGGVMTIVSQGLLPSVDNTWQVAGIGDFNGDGKSDILWRRNDGTNYVWHIDGATINGGVVAISSQGLLPGVDTTWSVAGIGDFNGDGKSDIFWRKTDGTNYVWHIDGSTINGGVLSIPSQGLLPGVDPTWTAVKVGADYNGDGKGDIFWRRTDGANYVWHVNGAVITGGVVQIASQGLLPTVDTSWTVVGRGDYDGDGKSDVFWRRNDGTNYLWMIDGATINGGLLTITSQGAIPGVDTSWSTPDPK